MRQPLRLRLATYNIHGGRPETGAADLAATARVLASLEADLIGLQEVHRYLPPPGVFQDQPRRLRRLLGMRVAFLASLGRGTSGYGNAVASRVAPRHVRRVRLPGGASWEPRVLLEADYEIDGRLFRFMNMHLGLHPAERAAQARAVAARVGAATVPVLAAGDWNAEPDSLEVAVIMGAGLRHCVPEDAPTFPAAAPGRRLDYLAASAHWEIEGGEAMPALASDHLALVATVVLRP